MIGGDEDEPKEGPKLVEETEEGEKKPGSNSGVADTPDGQPGGVDGGAQPYLS